MHYPVTLEDLTPRMRAEICTGYGVQSGWLSRVRAPYGHDGYYGDFYALEAWLGGGQLRRLQSVLGLALGLISDAKWMPWWRRPAWGLQALAFALAVWLGGAGQWHRGPPRTWDDLRALDPFAPAVPPWFSNPGIGSAHDPEYGWH